MMGNSDRFAAQIGAPMAVKISLYAFVEIILHLPTLVIISRTFFEHF